MTSEDPAKESFINVDQTVTLEGASARVYKNVGDIQLQLYVFRPPGHKTGDVQPAIVFFFGGGWSFGTVKQFEPHCKYFSSRGMLAMTADYRVKSRHNTTPFESVADAKSAIRWVRSHAKELDADPNRIVASGGSAGGHVAACAGLINGLDERSENLMISSVPNVLVLFNPALDISPFPNRFGERWREASPIHHIARGAPPTIIFHGTADNIIPFSTAAHFAEVMRKHSNRCELVSFEGKGHGFFNYARDQQAYAETVFAADRFLASLRYLQGPPTIARE